MTRCYSYARWSTAKQTWGDSQRRQSEAAAEYVERKGYGYILDDETFSDEGVSAYRGKNNADEARLTEFLKRATDGTIPHGSWLLVDSLDRLSRMPPMLAVDTLKKICFAGITIVTLDDEQEYTEETILDDTMLYLKVGLIFGRANNESKTKERLLRSMWKNKRAEAAQNGTLMTSRGPEWLDYDRDTKSFKTNEKAEVVRRIFREAAEGRTPNAIAVALGKDGVPSLRGKAWLRQQVAQLLDSPNVIGTLVPHRTEHDRKTGKRTRVELDPIPDYYPSVVDEDTYHRVRELRRNTPTPQRGRNADRPIRNLFGGVLRCALCGSIYTRTDKGNGNAYLVCTRAKHGACEYKVINYGRVQDAFIYEAPRLLNEAPTGVGAEEVDSQLADMEIQVDAADDAMRNIMAEIERGGRSPALSDRLRELEEGLESLRRERLELLEKRAAVAKPFVERRLRDLEEALAADPLDIGKANVLMRQVFAQIVLDREGKELVCHWKHGGESGAAGLLWLHFQE